MKKWSLSQKFYSKPLKKLPNSPTRTTLMLSFFTLEQVKNQPF
jgi:hypothetical protein